MRIAALSTDQACLQHISNILAADESPGELVALQGDSSQASALVEQEHPNLLIVNAPAGVESELSGLERIALRHPEVAVILLCGRQSPEFLLAAMRVGAREVLSSPPPREALLQAVGRLRERISGTTAPRSQGKVIALLPCKGGSGATFIATNLAHAVASENARVCLIDLNLHFGEAALYVSDATPSATIADISRDIQRLDSSLLESSLLKVTPNFGVLAAPDSPDKALSVKPENVARLLGIAKSNYDFVFLDLSRTMDSVAVKALDSADSIYLVLQLTLPFLRDASRLLQVFRSLGYPDSQIHLIINRFEKGGEISLADVERTLKRDVFKTIPNSFTAVAASINRGRPIAELAPRDTVTRALREMATELTKSPVRSSGWFKGLFGAGART